MYRFVSESIKQVREVIPKEGVSSIYFIRTNRNL